MMIKNENLIDRLKVNKSKSTSNILKYKIGIALGREKQLCLNSLNKKSMTKCTSYFGKQRSMSMRSLSKTTINPKEKLSTSTKRKMSFSSEQKQPNRNKLTDRSNMTSQSIQSTITQTTQTKIPDLMNDSYKNLIWIDCLNSHKLKIISKSIMTLGENRPQTCFEYCVQSEKNVSLLFRVQQDKLTLIERSNLALIKYDQKQKKKEYFLSEKLQGPFSLIFDGYIFICQSNPSTKEKNVKDKFDFLLQQIKKLNEDGLRDFTIVSKIVKRIFESKFFNNNNKEDGFCLLMKVQNRNYRQKQITVNKKSTTNKAEQLIAQKLLIEKTTLTSNKNNSQFMKITFNKKKFLN